MKTGNSIFSGFFPLFITLININHVTLRCFDVFYDRVDEVVARQEKKRLNFSDEYGRVKMSG